MRRPNHYILSFGLCVAAIISGTTLANAQAQRSIGDTLRLNDLSGFASPTKNWRVAGNAFTEPDKNLTLTDVKGSGILIKESGMDITTAQQYGDMDIDFDYMLGKGATTGIYLQGKYKINLTDSWGTVHPTLADNGGIDEVKNDKGYAPRQNVSRAPGLWQHIKISFQAPQFDAQGNKTSSAKILYVRLNGVMIQENVTLTGPTRDGNTTEAAMGPLRLQGGNGMAAFRNIIITNYSKPRLVLSNLKYAVYTGKFTTEKDFRAQKPVAEKASDMLTSSVGQKVNYMVSYTGNIRIKESGNYTFRLSGAGGMQINNANVFASGGGRGGLVGTVRLQPGDYPFSLYYIKTNPNQPSLGLTVSEAALREVSLGEPALVTRSGDDPVWLDAPQNTLVRSFMDIPGSPRVTHGVNVGSPLAVHYTYDMDNGTIVQAWRGDFLDASTMWVSRGDGSSRARGSVQYFGKPSLTIQKMANQQSAWLADTTGTGFKPNGYTLDATDKPTFKYTIYGTKVTDASTVIEGGQGIRRQVMLQNPAPGLYARLANGSSIEKIKDGLYAIDDKAYYIRLDDNDMKPMIRNIGGKQELIVPAQTKLTYSIIF